MIDLTGLAFFNPVFTFTLLFVIIYAILNKTKILGEIVAIQVIVSLVLSLIFVSVVEVRGYVESVVPGFAVLAVAIFFVLFMAAFVLGKADAIAKPWLAWVFIGIMALVFIYQGYHNLNVAHNSTYISIKDWVQDPRVAGGLWLVIFGGITVFAVTRKVK